MSNQMKTMSTRATAALKYWAPSVIAFAATLLALPIHAVTFPSVPLQSGAAYPPANIMFILDDSGSMAWDFMPGAYSPGEVPGTNLGNPASPLNVALRASARNTIYYDPQVTYQPWMKSDGTRVTGGTDFQSAYADDNLPQTPVNLDTRNETFYVLNSGGNAADTASYKRYRFLINGTVEQAPYTKAAGSQATLLTTTLSKAAGSWTYFGPYAMTSANDQLQVATTGGTGDADLYVRLGSNPTTSSYDCISAGATATETCAMLDPVAGGYYVGVYAYANISNVTLTVKTLSNYWSRSVNSATPTGRSYAAERTNFAIWYSYDRTRIKVAKAGASEAFGQIGSNLRVGYDTIQNRSRYPIPVGTGNGQFSSTNRFTWYERLQAANANGNTPLKGTLQREGEYFKDTTAAGPWGPETGAAQISCRQNFSILTTDGYWNNNFGYTPVGDSDNTAGATMTSTAGDYTYRPISPYIDNFKTTPNTRPDTLADVAMNYWKADLVPGLANNVPTSVADPAFWQHMTTFSISIGQQGTLNPRTDLPSITNGSLNWPDPIPSENTTRIDDLWHAAVNGRGSFVVAKNPAEFAQGLVDALSTVAARLGSASNVTANSTSFITNTRVYQASYVSGKWIGELAAYDATQAGISNTAAWKASGLIPAYGSRNIATWSGSAGVAFSTPVQKTALLRTTGTAPVSGVDNANYIAGSAALERRNGGTLRDRSTVLGDIAYSSPLYVKDSETIFVGANDGMLHAFSALTGVEQFAYVPAGINLTDLATLSDPQYAHKYFVDGPVVVSTTQQTPGTNYLVGALGRGGKGVFGLDVTNPGGFLARNNVLWESSYKLTAAQQLDMGNVLGEPLVVTLNDGSKGVLVSNGINSTSATAALFVLDIATGAVIKEIGTGVGSPGIGENGLFAPRGWDSDGNGTVDEVYAGDFKGNLWKFDFTGTASTSWKVAFGGNPMFKTKSGQPITTGLALAQDPATGKRWVFIGTGSFLTATDVTDNSVQSMYGIIDDGTTTPVMLSDLTKRTIAVAGKVNGKAIRGFEVNTPLDSTAKGWYVDLDQPTAGERIVSNPRISGGVLVTASIIPPTSNTCDAGGTGYINALDAFSGTSLKAAYFDSNGDGKVDSNDSITSNGDAVPVGSIDLGVGMPTLPTVIDKLLVVGGSKGSLGNVLVNPQGGSNQRVSWREILRD